MAKLQRLKRRMIRQAVQENLDTMRGVRRRHRERMSYTTLLLARVVFFLSVPAALFASTYVLSTVSSDWRQRPGPEVTQSRTPDTARVRASTRRTEAGPVAAIAIPEPIDPAVLPLALRTVVVDPGHGGANRGTMAPTGLIEKEVTLDIAERLRDLLQESSYHVIMTREEDRDLSLRDRAELANLSRGDIFISIHVNWLENREVRGVETFYLGATDDPYLEALAARENQDSGYSLADLRDILQQVYAGVRQEESRRLAEAVQGALFESLHQVNGTARDRGVKSAPFGVLTKTDMPAILAEVSCVSNQVEARLLMTPIYRQYLAEALFRGIESYSYGLNQAYEVGG